MAKYTRLAATLTARYVPAVGAVDGFYMDGRMAGKRESEQADITLDREDRGFFYAIYASSHMDRRDEKDESQRHKSLDHILEDMKRNDEHNIDEGINDLADCAVNVSGRLTLGDDGVLQPYFAGLMVKDAEIAAVTLGRVTAYLYRNDILYPLTEDDFPIEPIDTHGRNVPNINIYSAGSAATIRYSNIAQLQGDDCIIMCNKEVMETIGQKDMLDLLYEAEDAHVAAGEVMDRMAEESPDAPHQFFIAFVEDILDAEKSARFQGRRAKAASAAAAPAIFDTTGKVPTVGQSSKQQAQRQTQTYVPPSPTAYPPQDQYGYPDEQGVYAEGPYGHPQYQDQLYVSPERGTGKGRKAAIGILIFLALAIVAFMVLNYYFNFIDIPGLTQGTTTEMTTTEMTTTETTTVETTTAETTTAPTTTATTTETTEPTEPQPTHPDSYEIQPGDTLWQIVEDVYEDYGPLTPEDIMALIQQIQAANPDVIVGDNFNAGDVITIPEPQYDEVEVPAE